MHRLLLFALVLGVTGSASAQDRGPASRPARKAPPTPDPLKRPVDWGKQLRAGKLPERRAAGRELLMLGAKAEPALKFLQAALADGDRMVRYYAALSLSKLGPQATPATQALLRVLQKDDETQVRSAAATALGAIGPPAKAAVPELLLALSPGPGKATLRSEALTALKRIGKVGVPSLTIALKAKEALVRAGAAQVLAGFGPASAPAVKNLIICLDDGDERVRPQAAIALGRIGKKARSAIPGLTQALGDDKLRVRICVAIALGLLDLKPARSVPLLTEGLNHADPIVRSLTCQALGVLKTKASEFVPALQIALGDADARVKKAAGQALSQIAPAKKRAPTKTP